LRSRPEVCRVDRVAGPVVLVLVAVFDSHSFDFIHHFRVLFCGAFGVCFCEFEFWLGGLSGRGADLRKGKRMG